MTRFARHMDGRELVVGLSGRVDTANAQDVEEALGAVCAEEDFEGLVLDCEGLDYVSSTGLRVILRLSKAVGALRLTNVSPAVYDVLDMTGFTELFEVSRVYRRVSVSGCPVIGEGANGVVYRIGPDTICKVYRNPDALPEIHRERELARAAFVAGIPTAISYDVVRVGEGYGSVFELLDATSLAEQLASGERTLEQVARESADLLRQMAATEVDPQVMPSVRDEAMGWVDALEGELDPTALARLRELVAAVPDANTMVHGDFHIKNVMVQNDELLLIDMDTLGHGDPVFDLATTYSAYVAFGRANPLTIERFLGIPHEDAGRLWDLILHDYLAGRDEGQIRAAEDRARLVSSVRLMGWPLRHSGPEADRRREHIGLYRSDIEELLGRVESLAL